MINFIIYEANKAYQQIYKSIILQFIGPHFYSYRFRFFESFDKNSIKSFKNFDGEFVFILVISDDEAKTFNFARTLRNNKFWLDPIIIIGSEENLDELNTIIPVTYVDKAGNIETQLTKCLKSAYDVLEHHKSYKFKINSEIYQIPYEQILYFEKKLNDNTTRLVTTEDIHVLNKSISQIETELEDEYNFCKSHQSCIVNLDNVIHIDFAKNTIYFDKCDIDLISRNQKKVLKARFEIYEKYHH